MNAKVFENQASMRAQQNSDRCSRAVTKRIQKGILYIKILKNNKLYFHKRFKILQPKLELYFTRLIVNFFRPTRRRPFKIFRPELVCERLRNPEVRTAFRLVPDKVLFFVIMVRLITNVYKISITDFFFLILIENCLRINLLNNIRIK